MAFWARRIICLLQVEREHVPRVSMRRTGELALHGRYRKFINPRFEVSYWGMEHALPFMGKRANFAGGLSSLAGGADAPGSTPSRWSMRMSRRSTGERLAKADIVGVTRHEACSGFG